MPVARWAPGTIGQSLFGMRGKEPGARRLMAFNSPQPRGALIAVPWGPPVVKDVVAVSCRAQRMRVQTRSGVVILVGFRHKARGKAVDGGKALDQHFLNNPRFIGGAAGSSQCIRLISELGPDLPLNRGIGGISSPSQRH